MRRNVWGFRRPDPRLRRRVAAALKTMVALRAPTSNRDKNATVCEIVHRVAHFEFGNYPIPDTIPRSKGDGPDPLGGGRGEGDRDRALCGEQVQSNSFRA